MNKQEKLYTCRDVEYRADYLFVFIRDYRRV